MQLRQWGNWQAWKWAGIWTVVALAMYCAGHAWAQTTQPAVSGQSLFPTPDRSLRRWMRTARQLLEEKRYVEAIGVLQRILDHKDDYFQLSPGQSVLKSFKQEAQELIGQLPPEGREAYRLQFEAQARQLLRRGLQQQDVQALQEASRRYFHTPSGYRATFLLGRWHANRGETLAALLHLMRLAQVPARAEFEPDLSVLVASCWVRLGYKEQARRVLQQLRKEFPQLRVMLGQRPLPGNLPEEKLLELLAGSGSSATSAPDHPAQWLMVRGNPGRNASSGADVPISDVRWRVPLTNDPELLEQLHFHPYEQPNSRVIPAGQPLVVGNQVLVRTAEALVAIDFRTGKRLWQVSDQTALAGPGEVFGLEGLTNLPALHMDRRQGMRKRLWEDLTYGTMSSDGERVYVVQNIPLPLSGGTATRVVLPNGRVVLLGPGRVLQNYNLLQARSIRQEGKLVWELGGPEGQDALPLAGTFFLGPPLPLEGTLYVLGEKKGEIRLFALEATTGRVLWSQALVVVEDDIRQDVMRRTAGVSPSYADGVLICPTAYGAVVAVDLPTRSLRWGYVYHRPRPTRASLFGFQRPLGSPTTSSQNRWLEDVPVVVGDLVLLTPSGADELVAIELLSGKLRWKRPRGKGLYVAALPGGKVLVAEQSQALILNAQSGEVLNTIPFPQGHLLSGRGIVTPTDCLLPLSQGLLLVVDIRSGKITKQHRLRHGQSLGNLLAYGDSILSVGTAFVDCYYQQQALQQWVQRQLQRKEQDPTALAWQGALLIDQGQLDQALEVLTRAYQADQAPLARQLLLECSLGLLEQDYRKHAGLIPKIEQLLRFPEERLRYLVTLAQAQERTGEWALAFDTYLRLSRLPQGSEQLVPTPGGTLVQQQRWLGWRLRAVYHQASPQARKLLDQKIQKAFQQVRLQGSAPDLERFLAFYHFHPLADQARRLLLDQLRDSTAALHRELLLRRLSTSPNRQTAAEALWELVQLFHRAQRPFQAAWVLRELQRRYWDVKIQGQTPEQLAQRISWPPMVRRALQGPAAPVIQWEVPQIGSARSSSQRFLPIATQTWDSHSPGVVILYDQQRRTVLGQDALGHTLWKVSLATDPPQGYISPNIIHARVVGNFVLVSMGYTVYAIDALWGNGRLLWKRNLRSGGDARPFGIRTRMIGTPWGGRLQFASDNLGRPVGLLGPAMPQQVHIQVGNELLALDPLSGQTLWKRRGVTPGSVVFGDEQHLVVVPPGGGRSLVLDTTTGVLLQEVEAPDVLQRVVTTWGTCVLTWQFVRGRVQVELRDLLKDKVRWSQQFAIGSKAAVINRDLVAILEPKGQLTVLRLPEGERLIHAQVDVLPSLMEMQAVIQGDQLLVVANSRVRVTQEIGYVSPVPSGNRCLRLNGYIHAFDRRTGEHLWSTLVQNQGLVLDQPWAMPVLVLASHIFRRHQGRAATYHAIACIDRQTGRMVFEREFDGSIAGYRVQADPQSGNVDLLAGRRIRLLAQWNSFPLVAPEPKGPKEKSRSE